jgi:hypothetical protein
MNLVIGFLKAVFNFFVGDWIFLGGVTVLFVVLGLFAAALQGWAGAVLVAGIVAALGVSLFRETRPKR